MTKNQNHSIMDFFLDMPLKTFFWLVSGITFILWLIATGILVLYIYITSHH